MNINEIRVGNFCLTNCHFSPKYISTKFDGEIMLIRLVTDTCVNFIQLENMTGWGSEIP